jgi:hypothetical protein
MELDMVLQVGLKLQIRNQDIDVCIALLHLSIIFLLNVIPYVRCMMMQ